MTSKKRALAVALAGVLLLSSVAAAGTVVSAAANESLTVDVENARNAGATVTVTHNDSAVENASVTVETTNNSSYAGAGEYSTGENGTVGLPEPEEDVTVEVTAEKGNLTGATTAELTVAEEDENGSFGQAVSSFVHEMLNAGDDDGPIGQIISEYVTSNNPGSDNKPDHAGKSADAGSQGNSSAANSTDEGGSQGPPDDAGNDGDEKGNGNGNGHGNDKGDKKGDDGDDRGNGKS